MNTPSSGRGPFELNLTAMLDVRPVPLILFVVYRIFQIADGIASAGPPQGGPALALPGVGRPVAGSAAVAW